MARNILRILSVLFALIFVSFNSLTANTECHSTLRSLGYLRFASETKVVDALSKDTRSDTWFAREREYGWDIALVSNSGFSAAGADQRPYRSEIKYFSILGESIPKSDLMGRIKRRNESTNNGETQANLSRTLEYNKDWLKVRDI